MSVAETRALPTWWEDAETSAALTKYAAEQRIPSIIDAFRYAITNDEGLSSCTSKEELLACIFKRLDKRSPASVEEFIDLGRAVDSGEVYPSDGRALTLRGGAVPSPLLSTLHELVEQHEIEMFREGIQTVIEENGPVVVENVRAHDYDGMRSVVRALLLNHIEYERRDGVLKDEVVILHERCIELGGEEVGTLVHDIIDIMTERAFLKSIQMFNEAVAKTVLHEKERLIHVAMEHLQNDTPIALSVLLEEPGWIKAATVAQSLPKTPAAQTLPKTPAAQTLPKTPAAQSLPKTPAAQSLPKTPAAQSLPKTPAAQTPM